MAEPTVTTEPTTTPEQETTIDNSSDILEGVEVHTPLRLNEVLYDISSNYNAAILDLTDGIVQVKSIIASFLNDELWQDEDIREAAALSSLGNTEDFSNNLESGDENVNYSEYIEGISANLYSTFELYTEYALTLEYIVALIETELKNACPEDYDAIIASIKDTTDVNALGHLDEDLAAGKLLGVAGGRAGIMFGASMKSTGLAAWTAFKACGIDAVIQLPHGQMLKDAVTNFLNGKSVTGAIGGKVPTFGSRLVSGLGTAAIFFAIGVGYDALTGNFSWDNVAVRGAKALVGVGASLAGTAVTSALAGTAAGSWAGPIGMAVGAAIAVIGSVVIDAINHRIHYTSNELPRDYTPITIDYIREQMKNNGYSTGVSTVGSESFYDAMSKFICSTDNEEFLSYFIKRSVGDNIMTPTVEISDGQMQRYDDIVYLLTCRPTANVNELEHSLGELNENERAFVNTFQEVLGTNPDRFNEMSDFLRTCRGGSRFVGGPVPIEPSTPGPITASEATTNPGPTSTIEVPSTPSPYIAPSPAPSSTPPPSPAPSSTPPPSPTPPPTTPIQTGAE